MDSQLLSSCAVMQPYFLPYIGYFQLIKAVDTFVLYDDVEYTKKGWINRNRINVNSVPTFVTLPLKKDSDFLEVRERLISPDFEPKKLLNLFDSAYRRAMFYDETREVIESIVRFEDRNLFGFIHHSICVICQHLDISTPIVLSSKLCPRGELRGVERIVSLCDHTCSLIYINPPGGRELYTSHMFSHHGKSLRFLIPKLSPYFQGTENFIPALSIVDCLAHCGKHYVSGSMLDDYRFDIPDQLD